MNAVHIVGYHKRILPNFAYRLTISIVLTIADCRPQTPHIAKVHIYCSSKHIWSVFKLT